jgi:hypothetical protein
MHAVRTVCVADQIIVPHNLYVRTRRRLLENSPALNSFLAVALHDCISLEAGVVVQGCRPGRAGFMP